MNVDHLNVLTFTTLYPNAEQPTHGIFVENRLRQLVKRHPQVHVTVVAPVPWFPFKSRRFGRYADQARVPREEQRHGIRVLHPRYLLIPKFGMSLAPLTMFLSLYLFVRRLVRQAARPYDVLDAHYFYPDGVAAVMLGKVLRLPVVVTARGSDVNLIPKWLIPRLYIRWAARAADGLVAVSENIKQQIVRIAGCDAQTSVLRNGVDLDLFSPARNRQEVRARLGFNRFTLLCVGRLAHGKGHRLLLEALAGIPDAQLVLVGDGELKGSLLSSIESAGLTGRVAMVGALAQSELPAYYQAADVFVLASESEGWPNVLLEALACGTPVVSTDVGSAREIVGAPQYGFVVGIGDATALAGAVSELMRGRAEPEAIRRRAERFSWDATSDSLLALFRRTAVGGETGQAEASS